MPTSSITSRSSSKKKDTILLTSSTVSPGTPPILNQTRRAQPANSPRNILFFLIAFRILNALYSQTFFQPDEYFQSLEPAWQIAFGQDAGAWITWEWRHRLRSSIHPYIFAAGYRMADVIARYLHASPSLRTSILLVAPKIVQAHIAACGDYFTWKLGERVYGRGSFEAWICLALTVASPWQWFCSTRTLSNCLETTLTVVAMTYWPWEWSLDLLDCDAMADNVRFEQHSGEARPERSLRLQRCLVLAAFACVLRPTNILIWIVLAAFALIRWTKDERVIINLFNGSLMVSMCVPELGNATKRERWTLIRDTTLCGIGVLIFSVLCDWMYYGQSTLSPYNFLYFNVVKSLAVFYGRNDWHYYLSQGYPLLLTTYLPFAAIGIYQGLTQVIETENPESQPAEQLASAVRYELAAVSLIVPSILSFIAHKEVRFIYPILPILHVLSSPAAAAYIRTFRDTRTAREISTTEPKTSSAPSKSSKIHTYPQASAATYKRPWSSLSTYRPAILPSVLLLNLLIAIFSTRYHQRGVVDVMSYLRSEYETNYLHQSPESTHTPPTDTAMTVGFLMPCHSTPWRSHLIYPDIHAWALGCEPPLHIAPGPERQAYQDEADQFYADPQRFLMSQIGASPDTSTSRLQGKSSSSSPVSNLESSGIHLSSNSGAWNGGHGRKPWPDYLVFFEASSEEIITVLSPLGYTPCWRAFNSWFHDDWRRRGDVIVWRNGKTAGMQDVRKFPIVKKDAAAV